jgi:hypothetical protein
MSEKQKAAESRVNDLIFTAYFCGMLTMGIIMFFIQFLMAVLV